MREEPLHDCVVDHGLSHQVPARGGLWPQQAGAKHYGDIHEVHAVDGSKRAYSVGGGRIKLLLFLLLSIIFDFSITYAAQRRFNRNYLYNEDTLHGVLSLI